MTKFAIVPPVSTQIQTPRSIHETFTRLTIVCTIFQQKSMSRKASAKKKKATRTSSPRTYKKNAKKKRTYSKTYVPKTMSLADQKRQRISVEESREASKYGIYKKRKNLKSFHSRISPRILKAEKIYDKSFSELLKRVPGCTNDLNKQVISKGRGAYYSSGSRPNQTDTSWAYARLASVITGGKAAHVDRKIIEKYCNTDSIPAQLLRKST